MTRKKVSVLSDNGALAKMEFRIDEQVQKDLKALEERLDRAAPRKKFERDRVVETALRKAIQEANEELDELEAASRARSG